MSPDRLAFDIVDVFAERPYAGNQLAVVHGADHLSDAQRLAIAIEFGYSETTFPSPRDAASYAVRIVTPGGEIPFAGHPTLGTAFVLRERGELAGESAVQHCAAGEVGIRLDGDRVELTATPREPAGPVDEDLAAAVLADHGLSAEDRVGDAWVTGAGLAFVHVPVTEDAVVRAHNGSRALESYDGWPAYDGDHLAGLNLVAVEPGQGGLRVHSRVFVPGLLAAEDAATGSAQAGLGIALVASGMLPDGGGYTVRQGVEMGRPSRLDCHVEAAGGRATSCRVAGRVAPIAQGTLVVPSA
jgi:trans-2,3-dihydro-3-hydroxyanthranilate isomerase